MPEPERFFWTQEDIKAFPVLPEPAETFDLVTNESRVLRIIRWGLYQHIIHPRWPGAPAEKPVITLRVWMAPGYESPRAPYWDIHQGHLISLLFPFLQKPDYRDYEVVVTKRGEAPKAYFEVEFRKPV